MQLSIDPDNLIQEHHIFTRNQISGELAMTILKRTPNVIVLLAFFIAIYASGNSALAQDRGGRRQGPPPEAYTACEGKSAGDKAEFESPRGDTVTGTCVQQDDRLVLHPDNPPERGGRGKRTTSNG
jgi:hypothetical protein